MAVSKSLRYQILRRDNHACHYCGGRAPEVKLVVDHVVPEALGGRTVPENLRTACEPCNSGKSATPADAAMVQQVASDAARWAEAQKLAAQQMIAGAAAVTQVHMQFEKRWEYWTAVRGRKAYLPSEWTRSVDSFMAAGLPFDVVLDALDIAMGKKSITADSVFRYMAGICWARVADLREATAAIVGRGGQPARVSPSDPAYNPRLDPERQFMEGYYAAQGEVADEVLGYYSDKEIAELMAETRRQAIEEGDELGPEEEDHEDPAVRCRAAETAHSQQFDQREALEAAGRRVMKALGPATRERIETEARVVAEKAGVHYGTEMTEVEILCLHLNLLAQAITGNAQPMPHTGIDG